MALNLPNQQQVLHPMNRHPNKGIKSSKDIVHSIRHNNRGPGFGMGIPKEMLISMRNSRQREHMAAGLTGMNSS